MPRAPQEIKTFFTTAVTANRRRLFQVESNAQLLLDILKENRAKGRYQLHAFVIMPDHIHLLLTPAEDISLEKAMQFIKGGFSFRLRPKFPVWQESFTTHRIETSEDYQRHIDYIHQNPVRAHLCATATDFAFSSVSDEIDPTPNHLL
jgi:putative transposase